VEYLVPSRAVCIAGIYPSAMIHTKCACTRVRRAARALTDAYDDALKPLGLKVTQFSLLRTVARMEAPSLTALAQEMALDRSTLGRNVGILQRQGLVQLSEGSDLRERTVCLSPRARSRSGRSALGPSAEARRTITRAAGRVHALRLACQAGGASLGASLFLC
jgi:DNA-binding MarR family transcriptional regulator